MELTKIRELDISALYKELNKTRKDHQVNLMNLKTGKGSNLKQVRNLKKVVARIKTVISEKGKTENEKA